MPDGPRRRADPDLAPIARLGDWEVVPEAEAVSVARRLGAMISVRLDPDAARLVRRAARIEGITQSEFVRRAATDAARAAVERGPVTVTVRAPGAETVYWGERTEGRELAAREISTLTPALTAGPPSVANLAATGSR